jgi:hypothetical protein
MPRNSSGTMTLPAPGVPFQSGQVISSAQVNATFADVATEISDSASRSGKGNFTAPVRVPDGTAAAPAFAFAGEISTGWYRAGANDVRLTVGGVDALKLTGGGVAGSITFAAAGPDAGYGTIQPTFANSGIVLRGNRSATDAGADLIVTTVATRTAGQLAQVQNAGIPKLNVDYQGLLSLVTPATAIQAASIWTAITPNTGWTASGSITPGFAKDATGCVRLKGAFVYASGANPVFTLPAGYRPSGQINRLSMFAIGGPIVAVVINPSGTVSIQNQSTGALASGAFDGLSFPAEA